MIVDNEKIMEKIDRLKRYLNDEYCRKCLFKFTIKRDNFVCPVCNTKAEYLFQNNIYEYMLFIYRVEVIFNKMLRFESFYKSFIAFNFVNELKMLQVELETTIDIFKITVPRLKRKLKRDETFIMTIFYITVKLFGEINE